MFKQFAVVLIGLLIVLPTIAQDLSNDELDYLDEIETALATTTGLDTFKVEGEQDIQQIIEVLGSEIEQDIFQTVEAEFINTDDGQDAYLILEQELVQTASGLDTEIQLTQELLILDGELYTRVTNVEPAMIASLYPDEWISFSDDADNYDGLALVNPDQYLALLDAQRLTAPFSVLGDVASEVEVLDEEEFDGQTMTVYRVIMDGERLFSDEYMSESMSALNFDSLGFGADDLDMEVEDGAFIEYIYYIGQDDGYVHRIETIVEMELVIDGTAIGATGDVVIEQTAESEFNYFDFEESIKLPTP